MLGNFIRAQRQMADLSLRQLSALTEVSNPYLSQIERGLHEPSLRVLRSIADALNVSTETLLEQAGLTKDYVEDDDATERTIRTDRHLTEAQSPALGQEPFAPEAVAVPLHHRHQARSGRNGTGEVLAPAVAFDEQCEGHERGA